MNLFCHYAIYLMKFVPTRFSFSGSPMASFPKAMLFTRNATFRPSVRMTCSPSASCAASCALLPWMLFQYWLDATGIPEIVKLVKRRACAAAAAGDNRRADFHRLVERGGVEQAVKQIRQRAVRAGVVDGRADNQRIRCLELRGEGVYGIVKCAMVQHAAAPAGNAAADILLTDVDDFSRQPAILQGLGDFSQGKVNCAVRVGRTVE